MLVGCVVLLGWILDVPLLKSVLPGLATMKANTALGLVACGASLALQLRPAAAPPREVPGRLCALLALAIGSLTLVEHALDTDLGIDQFVIRAPAAELNTTSPGRMAPITALCFTMLGAVLLWLDSGTAKTRRALQALTVVALFVAFVALCGYLYDVRVLYGVAGYASMALHTATGFLVLSIGILAARPERGFVGALAQDNAAGTTVRRLLPVVALTPVVVGWFRLKGQDAGLYGTEFGLALMVLVCTAIISGVVIWTAHAQGDSETERKRANERFRLVVEATPNAIVMVDDQRRIARVNRSGEALFGYPGEELIGQPVEILVPPRYHAHHAGHVAAFLAGPSARPMGAGRDLFGRRRDGTEVPIEIGLNPIETEDGRFTLAFIVDISERKRATATQERLAAIVEYSEDAIISKTPDGLIASWNRGAEQLFGYTAEEAIGQSVLLIVPERLASEELDLIERVRRDKRYASFEAVRRRKDGTELDVAVRLSPVMNAAGEVIAESSITRDITELKRRDQELRRSNAELEQFAYVASHDLQEPLRMVANYTELLAQRYQGQLDEKADKYIHYAVDGARRMQRLVADLLAFSRVGSQGQPMQPTDSAAVLHAVVELLQRVIRSSGATVDVGDLPVVQADAGQLQQLFQNLVSNAIKFRSEKAPHIVVRAVASGAHWTFSVADNGIGLEMQYAERIFQMFQRLHELGKYEGSGIGLAIAKRIVERHGGRIWVESAPGAGTTFFFTLPAAVKGSP